MFNKQVKNYLLYTIAFLTPLLIMGLVFVVYHVYPFGSHSMLMTDQFAQYIQFYNHLYDVLKGNGSLLYTWESGLGLNFWGTFAYYLSSPISLVILFLTVIIYLKHLFL